MKTTAEKILSTKVETLPGEDYKDFAALLYQRMESVAAGLDVEDIFTSVVPDGRDCPRAFLSNEWAERLESALKYQCIHCGNKYPHLAWDDGVVLDECPRCGTDNVL